MTNHEQRIADLENALADAQREIRGLRQYNAAQKTFINDLRARLAHSIAVIPLPNVGVVNEPAAQVLRAIQNDGHPPVASFAALAEAMKPYADPKTLIRA